jgi:8-oxo-dGTP diphosphatase
MGPDSRLRDFHGAKGALLIDGRVLVTLRDGYRWISFPGLWDLPGGGREGRETPRETLAREVMEEVGLGLHGAEWLWAREFPSLTDPARRGWFFVLRLAPEAARQIVMADEGQGWTLMSPSRFVAMKGAVPGMQERLAVWLSSLEGAAGLP